ncbi:hypothetical protein LWI28_012620 [Acer negundo]|uniref:Uncharacterized protein n=1 Tax=Acer negundo TaxID=4023 RepID=A0AAD5I9I4_ACENE|nr:hypothetical protein LWI28_012620 [Acer negundo]
MVQETKYILKLIPMWSTFLVFGLLLSAGNTFSALQGIQMKSPDLLIYLILLQSITRETVSTLSRFLLSKWFPKARLKQNMMTIWAGMLVSILCNVVLWRVEKHHRLNIDIIKYDTNIGISNSGDLMSIRWLAPQFLLLGLMDGLAMYGLEDFTINDDHLFGSMKNFLSGINTFIVTGIGSTLNIIFVFYSNKTLFYYGLNDSRLDLYYKYLTKYGTPINCVYLLLISIFVYRLNDAAQVNEESTPKRTVPDGNGDLWPYIEPQPQTMYSLQNHICLHGDGDPEMLHGGYSGGGYLQRLRIYGDDCCTTLYIRWIDKAAIIEFESTLGREEQEKAGRLWSVTMVQETKYILKLIPMWSTFLVFGLLLSAGNTFSALQGIQMKSPDLLIYLILLQSITRETVSTLSRFLLSKWFPKARLKQNMMTIWAGMLVSILCNVVLWRVEKHHRLNIDIIKYDTNIGISNSGDLMSIRWLAPQFLLLGLMDGLAMYGLEDFTINDDHLFGSMKNFLSGINTFIVTGIGSTLNIIFVFYSNKTLFYYGLNDSRLDLYYKYLTKYGTPINCVYLLLISIFVYRLNDAAQFLLGVMEGLGIEGLEHFTRDDDHLSKSMKRYRFATNTFVVIGIGNSLDILCVYSNIILFLDTLDDSRFDLYYKYLIIYVTPLNCVYLLMVSIFIYGGIDATQLNEASIVIYRGSDPT